MVRPKNTAEDCPKQPNKKCPAPKKKATAPSTGGRPKGTSEKFPPAPKRNKVGGKAKPTGRKKKVLVDKATGKVIPKKAPAVVKKGKKKIIIKKKKPAPPFKVSGSLFKVAPNELTKQKPKPKAPPKKKPAPPKKKPAPPKKKETTKAYRPSGKQIIEMIKAREKMNVSLSMMKGSAYKKSRENAQTNFVKKYKAVIEFVQRNKALAKMMAEEPSKYPEVGKAPSSEKEKVVGNIAKEIKKKATPAPKKKSPPPKKAPPPKKEKTAQEILDDKLYDEKDKELTRLMNREIKERGKPYGGGTFRFKRGKLYVDMRQYEHKGHSTLKDNQYGAKEWARYAGDLYAPRYGVGIKGARIGKIDMKQIEDLKGFKRYPVKFKEDMSASARSGGNFGKDFKTPKYFQMDKKYKVRDQWGQDVKVNEPLSLVKPAFYSRFSQKERDAINPNDKVFTMEKGRDRFDSRIMKFDPSKPQEGFVEITERHPEKGFLF